PLASDPPVPPESYPLALHDALPIFRTAEQAAFQMVNTVATMDPLTKESKQITSAAMIPTMVRDAFRVAQAERPGPVHLELPEDIAALPVDGFELIEPHTNGHPVA